MTSGLIHDLEIFSAEQRRHIYDNAFTIQLTEGCSLGCDFCGYDTPKGVRDHIPFSDLEMIADEMVSLTDRTTREMGFMQHNPKRLYLYDESEPLDYEDRGKDYFDVLELFESRGFKVFTSTAIPKGKEELAVDNLDKIGRVSISHMNRERLEPYFNRLGVVLYIDLFNYYRLKYGERVHYDSPMNEGQVPVRGSVGKTIARLKLIDPSLPAKTRYYDVRKDGNKPHEDVQDIDTLVLWCGREEFPPRDGIITDRDEVGVLNFGRAYGYELLNIEPWQRQRVTFSRMSGVKLSPGGVSNVMSVARSSKSRTGRVVERVDPDDFKILEMKWRSTPSNKTWIGPWEYAKIQG